MGFRLYLEKYSYVFISILCLGLAACTSVQSVSSSREKLKRIAYVSHLDNSQREYLLYLPQGYTEETNKKWPLLLFLHGNGERGNGLDELDFVLSHGPLYEAWIQKKPLPFIIISPQLHMFDLAENGPDYLRERKPESIPRRLVEGVPARESEFPREGLMDGAPAMPMEDQPLLLPKGWDLVEQDLLAMLEYAHRHYRTDRKRVSLSGLSYGGFGSWYMASKHPELFAALAPVVGWGHPDLMPPIARDKVPLWVFAGGRDPLVPASHFYPGLNKLEALGHDNVRFTNHEDMAHDAWRRVYSSEDFYSWLLRQRLDSP